MGSSVASQTLVRLLWSSAPQKLSHPCIPDKGAVKVEVVRGKLWENQGKLSEKWQNDVSASEA